LRRTISFWECRLNGATFLLQSSLEESWRIVSQQRVPSSLVRHPSPSNRRSRKARSLLTTRTWRSWFIHLSSWSANHFFTRKHAP
jgi:hypothetical protein